MELGAFRAPNRFRSVAFCPGRGLVSFSNLKLHLVEAQLGWNRFVTIKGPDVGDLPGKPPRLPPGSAGGVEFLFPPLRYGLDINERNRPAVGIFSDSGLAETNRILNDNEILHGNHIGVPLPDFQGLLTPSNLISARRKNG